MSDALLLLIVLGTVTLALDLAAVVGWLRRRASFRNAKW
jgi:hypothetical protein